jgi:hypothetical protein
MGRNRYARDTFTPLVQQQGMDKICAEFWHWLPSWCSS